MLYINLSDSEIEVLQIQKTILGEEKIVSSIRREIPEGLIINGLIVDPNKFKSELQDIFSAGYPKSIKGGEVSLSISDKQILIERLSLQTPADEGSLQELIINEARKVLPYDPLELVNFYKVISKSPQGQTSVLYTAATRHTLVHFGRLVKMLGLEIVFLSCASFAIFELVKYLIGENEKILYASCSKKDIEYFLFDAHGPVATLSRKSATKHFTKETKEVIEDLEKEKDIKISKIIVGGMESINLETVETSEGLGRQIVKLGEVLPSLTQKLRIKFDTGGIPQVLFAETLGLLLLSNSKTPPNFGEDIKTMDLSYDFDEEVEKLKRQGKAEFAKVEGKESFIISEELPMVEYKESLFGQLFKNKWLMGVASIMVALLVIAGVVITLGRSAQIPFLTLPSPTLFPTVAPTITPTPTLDPSLKREGLKVLLQNGTTKTGFAKETATFLEEIGYKNVGKGNADRDDYEKTVIKIKPTKKNYLSLLSSDLKDKFDTSTIEDLEDDSSFDAVIILGNK